MRRVVESAFKGGSTRVEAHVDPDDEAAQRIATFAGLTVAYDAYMRSLAGKPRPADLDGFTAEQRFFLGWAQVWAAKSTPEAELQQVKTDPHSPGQFRANGTMMNQPAFYEAFNVKPGDKMYLAPKDRVIIW